MPSECLFCGIASGEVPADIVHQDDLVVAFRDIAPAAPTHLLVIPIEHVAVNDLWWDGQLWRVANELGITRESSQ